MEFSSFLEIIAENQGSIDGDSGHADFPNAIRVFDFNHSISVPVAASQSQSGLKAEVVHAPVIITKEIDKTTPKLYQALVEREMLESASFTFMRYDPSGGEVPYYRVKLDEAMIVKAAPWTPEKHNQELRFMESIHLVYRNITWSWGESESVIFEAPWRAK